MRRRNVAGVGLCVVVACGDASSGGTGAGSEGTGGVTEASAGSTDDAPTDSGLTEPSDDGSSSDDSAEESTSAGGELAAIEVLSLAVAQTHVLPDGERAWQLEDGAHSLHVVGGRSLLALVELGEAAPADAVLEAVIDDAVIDHADDCLTDEAHQIDDQGRCVKQDPMQSGSGDQAPGYKYTLFSDFNASVIQRYFEGMTKVVDGVTEYDGGVMFVDPLSSTGYSRWDGIAARRIEVGLETVDNGLYGFDRGLPAVRDVAVHTILFTISGADTPGASQIYPPLSYTGNLRRQVDPTVPADLATIVPNTGDVAWYCHASGCDYTLRVTYADLSVRHVLVRGGFRPWFDPQGAPAASTMDPVNGDSFRVFAVNVPGDVALAKIEVLGTPMGWNGVAMDAPVLLTRG